MNHAKCAFCGNAQDSNLKYCLNCSEEMTNDSPVNKESVTEQYATLKMINYISESVKESWSMILCEMEKANKSKIIIKNQDLASYNFVLATIALDLQATNNLFTNAQANRIHRWAEFYLNTEEFGNYAKEELKAYETVFQETVKRADGSPIDSISLRLLSRLFEDEQTKQRVEVHPILILCTSFLLTKFITNWKKISETFTLVKSDENPQDLG